MLKLNNRGWGLSSIIAGIGVFAVALLIVVVLVNNSIKELSPDYDKNNEYIDEDKYDYSVLEDKIVLAAEGYANKKDSQDFDEDTLITVTIKKLQKENLLDPIYDLKNNNKKCSGYVTFSKKNNRFKFEPYLKCGNNYQTKGYERRFDDR